MGDLKVQASGHQVTSRGQQIELTRSEFKLLVALSENKGRVLLRDTLIKKVQGGGVDLTHRTRGFLLHPFSGKDLGSLV